MSRRLVSIRRDSGDPVIEAFTDRTYAWMEELKADFLASTGEPMHDPNGVLFASSVLVALHHHDACWSRFDVADLERWVHENAPGMTALMPSIVADLSCFTNYLARTGRLSIERAIATERRLHELIGLPPPPPPTPSEPLVAPYAPRNRAERRAARARARRAS